MSVTQPNASIIIWNYKDRMVPPAGANIDVMDVVESLIPTTSIKSISTNKTKGQPGGLFDIELAPTNNWTSAITVSSWIAILMSSTTPIDTKTANQKTLKMIGRIESVRTVCQVDPTTGARHTTYLITGSDWTSVFNTKLYIDSLTTAFTGDGAHSLASLFFVKQISKSETDLLPDTTQAVKGILNMYGILGTPAAAGTAFDSIRESSGIQISPQAVFEIPKELKSFLQVTKNNFTSFKSATSGNSLSAYIHIEAGPLSDYDKYDDSMIDSYSLITGQSFIGAHTYWEVMSEHCNPILNELNPEMRWSDSGPTLTLYKRIKPFTVNKSLNTVKGVKSFLSNAGKSGIPFSNETRSQFASAELGGSASNLLGQGNEKLKSLFKNIRRTYIPIENILSINAGTNSNNRINFIEVLPNFTNSNLVSLQSHVKREGQVLDDYSAKREGLKPMLLRSSWYANENGSANFTAVTSWKTLLKDWYFNTHNMLDGSVELVGFEDYVATGDNIAIPVAALNQTPNFKSGLDGSEYLLAHIEKVQNNFTVDQNGARHFTTLVQFSRGIFTDKNGDTVGSVNAIDDSASAIKSGQYNNNNVVG